MRSTASTPDTRSAVALAHPPGAQTSPQALASHALRAIYNDGRPLMEVSSELLILIVWTALTTLLALRLFRWR